MIRCPNHGWRFGPDGRCNQIPYSTMPLPPTIGINAWHLEERPGCIFAWHDPAAGEPTNDPPLFQTWADPRWLRWTLDELAEMHVQHLDLAEPAADTLPNPKHHGKNRIKPH